MVHRWKVVQKKMADLPVDRLSANPPFAYVGVDVFGRWTVISRQIRDRDDGDDDGDSDDDDDTVYCPAHEPWNQTTNLTINDHDQT